MLQQQHPYIGRFQDPVLSDKLAMVPQRGEFIPVLNVNHDHWLTISNIRCSNPYSIKIFDSLGGRLPNETKKVVADSALQSFMKIVKKQDGGSNCGWFAQASTTSLCNQKRHMIKELCESIFLTP